jgi:hypothetical protein
MVGDPVANVLEHGELDLMSPRPVPDLSDRVLHIGVYAHEGDATRAIRFGQLAEPWRVQIRQRAFGAEKGDDDHRVRFEFVELEWLAAVIA